MKALQLVKPRLFQAVEIARPEIGDDQILLRPERAVLCGSDIPKFTGMWPGLKYPLPAGMPIHECIGTVVESRSARFDVGDVVVALPEGDQGLAEHYVARANGTIRIPEPLLQSEASLLIQPLSTLIYAVDKLGEVADRTAIVVGLGPIGLLATWLLRQYGARVAGVDPIAWRCEVAQGLGASQTYDMHSDRLASFIAQEGTWQPADICVEAVGQQTRTINDCLYFVKHSGLVLTLGVPLEPIYPFNFPRFFRQNLHLIASVTPPDDTFMIRAADLLTLHERELAFMITHRFELDRAVEAYTLYETPASGRSLKVMIDCTSWQKVPASASQVGGLR